MCQTNKGQSALSAVFDNSPSEVGGEPSAGIGFIDRPGPRWAWVLIRGCNHAEGFGVTESHKFKLWIGRRRAEKTPSKAKFVMVLTFC